MQTCTHQQLHASSLSSLTLACLSFGLSFLSSGCSAGLSSGTLTPGGGVGGACPPDVPLPGALGLGSGAGLVWLRLPPPMSARLGPFGWSWPRFRPLMSVLPGPLGLFSVPFGGRFSVFSGSPGSVSGLFCRLRPGFRAFDPVLGAFGPDLGSPFRPCFPLFFRCFSVFSGVFRGGGGPRSPGPFGPKPVQQPLGAFGPLGSWFFGSFLASFSAVLGPFRAMFRAPFGARDLRNSSRSSRLLYSWFRGPGPQTGHSARRAQKRVFLGSLGCRFRVVFRPVFPGFRPSAGNP